MAIDQACVFFSIFIRSMRVFICVAGFTASATFYVEISTIIIERF